MVEILHNMAKSLHKTDSWRSQRNIDFQQDFFENQLASENLVTSSSSKPYQFE
jgi:hypothetical protein